MYVILMRGIVEIIIKLENVISNTNISVHPPQEIKKTTTKDAEKSLKHVTTKPFQLISIFWQMKSYIEELSTFGIILQCKKLKKIFHWKNEWSLHKNSIKGIITLFNIWNTSINIPLNIWNSCLKIHLPIK